MIDSKNTNSGEFYDPPSQEEAKLPENIIEEELITLNDFQSAITIHGSEVPQGEITYNDHIIETPLGIEDFNKSKRKHFTEFSPSELDSIRNKIKGYTFASPHTVIKEEQPKEYEMPDPPKPKKIDIPVQKVKLSEEQIESIVSVIVCPYDIIPENCQYVEKQVKDHLRNELKDIQIYPQMIPKLKEEVEKKYLVSLMQPGFAIGPVAADAVGEEATQVVLDFFHSAGEANKGGGIDSFRELISIAKERKAEFSVLHFKHTELDFDAVMRLKWHFMEVTVESLIESKTVISLNKNNVDWWYRTGFWEQKLNDLFQNPKAKRLCLRLVLNKQKLYEHMVTTHQVARLIETFNSKKHGMKKDDKKFNLTCIYSPTLQGVVDVFINSNESSLDMRVARFHQESYFAKMVVSGIAGIKNYYPVKVTIRDVFRTHRKEEGMLKVYLKNLRFNYVPFCRIKSIIEKAGYQIDRSLYEVMSEMYLFQYLPRKIELRKKINVTAPRLLTLINKPITQVKLNWYVVPLEERSVDITMSTYFGVNTKYEILGPIQRSEGIIRVKVFLDQVPEAVVDFVGETNYDISIDLPYINSPSCLNDLETILANHFRDPVINIKGIEIANIPKYIPIVTNDDFKTFLAKIDELPDKDKYYFYAETTGSALIECVKHPLLNKNKVWCNNYHKTYDLMGIEALRNLLALDCKNMINSGKGFISGVLLNQIVDTLTFSGKNPMTSNGIVGHGHGVLTSLTFDRVMQHLQSGFTGKRETTKPTSSAIIMGQKIKFGTGSFRIINESEIRKKSSGDEGKESEKIDYEVDQVNAEGEVLNLPSIYPVTFNRLGNLPAWVKQHLFKNKIKFLIKSHLMETPNTTVEKTSIAEFMNKLSEINLA